MSALLPAIDREVWFATRLREHGAPVFDGVTTPEERRERCRQTIIDAGLATVIVGRDKAGKPLSYAQAFERLYGEPLAKIRPAAV